MKLNEYVKTTKPGRVVKAFNVVKPDYRKKINLQMLYQWRHGLRGMSAADAYTMERATNGAVTRKDLRDDWADIWPELENQ